MYFNKPIINAIGRLSFLFLGLLQACCAQTTSSQLNLDFETVVNGYPKNWFSLGSPEYRAYSDVTIAHGGNYSAVIESDDNAVQKFKTLAIMLPKSYEGKEIMLSAYIKTENVQNGFASLMIRLDPGVGYKVMEENGITGTTNWTKYQISLPLQPTKTSSIAVGGFLVGTGKMWLDDFKISIDGEDIETIPEVPLPADLDKEFDDGLSIPIQKVDVPNLALLGKVWGFLKYYHPSVAKGNLNWDYELLRLLPIYTKTTSDLERDAVLLDWVEKVGPVPVVKDKDREREILFKPDHSWIDGNIISQALKDKLLFIYSNRDLRFDHYYVAADHGTSKPIFKNESSFSHTPFPNREFRLLSLFRYWNIINYFFPYKSQTDRDWNDVLLDYIPKFLACRNELEYELNVTRIICEIGDSHAKLWGGGDKLMALRGNYFPPLQVRFIEGQLVVTDVHASHSADSIALETGDIITQINDINVQVIVDSLKPIICGAREKIKMRDIAQEILRSNKPSLKLTYIRENKTMTAKLNLILLKGHNVDMMYNRRAYEPFFKQMPDNIGYVNVPSLKDRDIPHLIDTMRNTKGIIIDLRFGKYFDTDLLARSFVRKPTDYVRISRFNRQNIGEFYLLKPWQIVNGKEFYRGKVVVLVDENTQSSAEWATMTFSVGDAVTIIGSNTTGTDGNMTNINLPGGLITSFSGIGVYYPDGGITQRLGITPDLIVYPTLEGIRKGKDEVLERGIREINAFN